MTNAEKLPDSEWLRNLAVGLELLGLTMDREIIRTVDRLEELEKWQVKAMKLLERGDGDECLCLGKPKDFQCYSCTAKRLLADAPKGGGDES